MKLMTKIISTKSTLLRYCEVFVLMLACYLSFAFVACLMPNGKIQHHVTRSMEKGDLQSDYPHAILPIKQAQMDNFTDALILNQAYCINRGNLLNSMMLLPRADYGMVDQTANLQHLLQGESGQQMITYPRYWHGSTFLMRYLLVVFDYPAIRLILYILSSLLFAVLLLALWKTDGRIAVMAVITSFLLLYGFVMQFSIQFFPVLALALIGSIVVCRWLYNPGKVSLCLFIVGSLTAYFDLLTVPLLTFGLPITLFCYFRGRMRQTALMAANSAANEKIISVSFLSHGQYPFGKDIVQATRMGLAWAVGFGLTWISKWLIATLTTPVNVFLDAFGKVSERAGAQSDNVWGLADFSRWHAVTSNAQLLPYKVLIIIILLLALLAIVRFNKKGWKTSLLLLGISLLPYVWYFVVANHSYQHWWLTYRAQMFSVTALLLAMANIVDWPILLHKTRIEQEGDSVGR